MLPHIQQVGALLPPPLRLNLITDLHRVYGGCQLWRETDLGPPQLHHLMVIITQNPLQEDFPVYWALQKHLVELSHLIRTTAL